MILKSYETSKIDSKDNNLILFYGKNEGLKKDKIILWKIFCQNHFLKKIK